MKILFEHNGILPIKRYGGTERIIYWLMKDLVKRGHKVYLIANSASDVKQHGIELIPRTSDDWRRLIPSVVDIVHLFSPTNFELDCPYLLTVEGNGQEGEAYPKNTVFVSKKHAQNHASLAYVYNGIDLDEYPYRKGTTKNWKNFLFLAKAKWKVKNLKDCIKVCRKNNKHLHVAGGRVFTFSRYIHSYGMVDQVRKLELLRRTDALLFPVRWHEPFGIAIIEAMALGLPVIGSPYGSLPELIKRGTGIICNNYDEFVEAVSDDNNRFRPDEIRNYVENNFSIQKMADDYMLYYDKVIKGKKINRILPTNVTGNPPETLLPF
ncbi:MAG: glycosyltransferase [Proteobacteria bacterium]|nr:glycosyltransferase [Pseudomonadota bacterium]